MRPCLAACAGGGVVDMRAAIIRQETDRGGGIPVKGYRQFVQLCADASGLPVGFTRNHREWGVNRRTALWKIRSGRAAGPLLAPGARVFRGVRDRANRIAPSRTRTR